MALIKCSKCGHVVSDKASVCPNCGCPIESVEAIQDEMFEEKPEKSKGWIWALIVALLCLIGGGGYYAYTKLFNGGSDKDAIVKLTPEFIKAVQQYEQLGVFSEGMAAVKKGNKWGYINNKGEEIIPCEYTSAQKFSEGLAPVGKNDSVGFINSQGKIVIPFDFKFAMPFSEGLAAVYKDDHWGFIDSKGQEIIPFAYTSASQFCDGLSLVMKEETPIYIDKQGKQAFPIPVEEPCGAGVFSNGRAFIAKDYENFAVIDTKGEIVFTGNWFFSEFGSGPFLESSQLPVYVNGLLSVPNEEFDFDIYDEKGKKINTSMIAVPRLIDPQDKNFTYTLTFFNSENGTNYMTYGLKDDAGKIILKGIYESINNFGGSIGIDGEQPMISNGVMLVTLIEYEDQIEEGYAGGNEANPKTIYYGYADLQGHDTFTQEVKDRCRKSREKAMQKLDEKRKEEEKEMDDAGTSDWLQGRWIGTDNGSGYPIEVIIDGDNLIQKINGQICYNGSYQFNGDFIVYNDGNDFWPVDNDRQVLTYDDLPMRKESGNSSISSTSSNSPSWIQGTWTYDMNSPVGTIASYKIVIEGNTMSFYRNGKQMWSEQFTYKNGKLIGGSHELRTNEDSHRIIDENGNRYNGRGSSSPFQFKTGHDVIGYLSGKTYRRDGNSLQIRQDGCYINGQCVSGAPVVTNYSSYSATVRANLIPSGTITFYINSKDGTMTNSLGESWH